ncbi:MAG: hypothetical protein ACQEQT_05870 [Chloroflexota bacterium]
MHNKGMNDNEIATIPTIPFGPHRISRLILGANPINGGSHLSRFVDQQMRHYFTPQRVLDLLARCEAAGINTWQSGPQNLDLYEQHRGHGGGMHYVSLFNPQHPETLSQIVQAGAIAIAHHGEVTDVLFKENKIDHMEDALKRIRDTGRLVGVSTHMPAVVDYVESAGWDVDFYMTCVYERHRSREALQELLSHVPIRIPEVYLEDDPPRMWKVMRQTSKPCLAFKILAAGRLCERQETVEEAFRETFQHIKENDAIIVGMYPAYEDQVRLNADYVRRFSALSGDE